MEDAEQPNIVELATEIVSAYVSRNSVPSADLPGLLVSVHDAVAALGQTRAEPAAEPPQPKVPVRKSITNDYIVCLDDGLKFKSLKRHLAQLGMTPDEYRAKWGLSADYPMVAPAYAKQRSELARSIGLGRKSAAVQPAAPVEPPKKRGRAKAA